MKIENWIIPTQDTTGADSTEYFPMLMDSLEEGSPSAMVNDSLFAKATQESNDSLFAKATQDCSVVNSQIGDPVHYTLRGDDTVNIVLLGSFCLTIILFGTYRKFFSKLTKATFFGGRSEETVGETSAETRAMLLLCLIDCLMLGLATYFCATRGNHLTMFVFESHATVIALFTAVFLVYFILRWLLYSIVNLTFFDVKKNLHWSNLLCYLTAIEGVMLFPIIILQVYLGFSFSNALICYAIVLILNKIMLYYHCFHIFFYKKSAFMQNILYLCAFEIVPLLSLGGILKVLTGLLIINF